MSQARVRARERARGGFTLVEVLVTLAVTAILLSLVGEILVSCLTTQKKIENTLLRERIGSAILDLISHDFIAVYGYSNSVPGVPTQALFKGTSSMGPQGPADEVDFLAVRDPTVHEDNDPSSTAPPPPGAFSQGGATQGVLARQPAQLTMIQYRSQPSTRYPGLLTLFRTESHYIPPVPQAAGGGGGAAGLGASDPSTPPLYFEVYDKVKSFHLRYLFRDPSQPPAQAQVEWRDVWDVPDLLPVAVEISLEIAPDPKADLGEGPNRARRIYYTTVAITATVPRP